VPTIGNPHFVTHRELNDLVGERTRQRWESDGLLPAADWLRVDRHRLGIYPELVLARVVVGNTRDSSEAKALSEVVEKSRCLFTTDGYHRFKAAARDVFAVEARTEGGWNFGRFLRLLADSDPDAIEAWQADVVEVEVELAKRMTLSFRSTLAKVRGKTSEGYTIAIETGEERLIGKALSSLEPGVTVVLERVAVESKEREFVLPAMPLTGASEIAEDLRLAGGNAMEHIDPFERIASREPFSALDYLDISTGTPTLSIRSEFERGMIPGLLSIESEAPYVEADQIFSFAFDSELIETRVPA
jgi:hypothetical protein